MFKTLKTKTLGAAALVLAALGFAPEAKAYDQSYCREYTRTVYVGGRSQDAFGTACLQPDGDWVIVGEGLGNDLAYADNVSYVIRDNRRVVTPTRVVYYDRSYYRSPRVSPLFIWYNDGRYYRNGHYYKYKKWNRHDNRRWDRHDRHDHHHGRGHGRGHGHGR